MWPRCGAEFGSFEMTYELGPLRNIGLGGFDPDCRPRRLSNPAIQEIEMDGNLFYGEV